jgi:branched-chain amino acid transport system substrate-binding protein
MRKWIFCLAATAAVFVSGVAAARAEVRIGVALPRTGPLASIGEQITNGVTAAVKAVNENAPETERIVLDIEDDACDPKQAVSVANKFVADKIGLVVGHVCSGASITVMRARSD